MASIRPPPIPQFTPATTFTPQFARTIERYYHLDQESLFNTRTFVFFQLRQMTLQSTRYLIQDSEGDLYWGEMQYCLAFTKTLQTTGIALLPRTQLPTASFFPLYDCMTMMQYLGNVHDPGVFIKNQSILSSDRFFDRTPGRYAELTSRELRVAETLASYPHPNICAYLGAVVHPKSLRVTGLAYQRYTCDLQTYIRNRNLKSAAQISIIMFALREAKAHMHALGFVHCDIRPPNIFLRLAAEPTLHDYRTGKMIQVIEEVVLGDFDATVRCGECIEMKFVTDEFRIPGVGFGDVAWGEVDDYAVSAVECWLWMEKRKGEYPRGYPLI